MDLRPIMETVEEKSGWYKVNQAEPIRVEVTLKFDEPLSELMTKVMEKMLQEQLAD